MSRAGCPRSRRFCETWETMLPEPESAEVQSEDQVIRSTVNTIEMRRACSRLLARLPDERGSGNSSVVFTAGHDSVHIQIGDSSEIVPAIVVEAGVESLPCLQFSGMVQTLRFYRKNKI